MSEKEFDELVDEVIVDNKDSNNYSKTLLFIINPNSGKGNSEQLFYTQVLPYFEKNTDYKIEYCISRYSNHIDYYISQNKNIINQYDSLIILGGDGMFHLTLNSLLKNNVKIPLGIIPTGSGNGLMKSIFYERVKDKYTDIDCYNLIKEYRLKDIDTINISSNTGYLTSFLSISWGIISDLDVNTEFMRFLGSIRFDIGAVWNILRKRSYTGCLTYKQENGQFRKVTGKFIHLWAGNSTYASSTTKSSPKSLMSDGYIYISYILDNVSRVELAKIMLGLEDGSFIEHEKVKYVKTKNFRLEIIDGMIVVDGEKTHFKNIDCNIHPKSLSLIC